MINTLNVSLNEEERKHWQRWQNLVEERAGLPNFDGTPFFHGTNHESALNILQEGIDITRGGQRLDFSDGEDFISRTASLKVFNMLNLLDLEVLRTTLIWGQQL